MRNGSVNSKARRRSAEAAWPLEPDFVRPQTEGEQPQARGTITTKRPSAEQMDKRTKKSRLTVGFGREDEKVEEWNTHSKHPSRLTLTLRPTLCPITD